MRRQVLAIMTALLVTAVQQMGAQAPASLDRLMASANHKATIDGDLRGAIADYADVVARAGANRAVAAQALYEAVASARRRHADAGASLLVHRKRLNQPRTASSAACAVRSTLIGETDTQRAATA